MHCYVVGSIRRDAIQNISHIGYYTILRNFLENAKNNKDYFILTSNIDNYFIQSGYDSNKIYETHGSVEWLQCIKKMSNHRCNGIWLWPESYCNASNSSSSSSLNTTNTCEMKDIANTTTTTVANTTTTTGVVTYPTVTTTATTLLLDDKNLTCDLKTIPKCPSCNGLTRANVSHETDSTEDDIECSRKNKQRKNFWNWLRKFRRYEVVEDIQSYIPIKYRKQCYSGSNNNTNSYSGSNNNNTSSQYNNNNKKKKMSKSGSTSTSVPTSSSSTTTATTHNNNTTNNKSPPKRLVILEIGCGNSIHSLRSESELLMSYHPYTGIPHAKLIRIDLNLSNQPMYTITTDINNTSNSSSSNINNNGGVSTSTANDDTATTTTTTTTSFCPERRVLGFKCSAIHAIESICSINI